MLEKLQWPLPPERSRSVHLAAEQLNDLALFLSYTNLLQGLACPLFILPPLKTCLHGHDHGGEGTRNGNASHCVVV